jgi:hypothetical protein
MMGASFGTSSPTMPNAVAIRSMRGLSLSICALVTTDSQPSRLRELGA